MSTTNVDRRREYVATIISTEPHPTPTIPDAWWREANLAHYHHGLSEWDDPMSHQPVGWLHPDRPCEIHGPGTCCRHGRPR